MLNKHLAFCKLFHYTIWKKIKFDSLNVQFNPQFSQKYKKDNFAENKIEIEIKC